MRLVFCGTPDFAVPSLEAVLAAGHEVALVLTQPDRPAGRKMELHAPPVKTLALERGLAVEQPEKIKNNAELRERLEGIAPDAIVVVAYGRIIPAWMLELPRFGCINVHGSLLPKYRGAAPIQWAVANGEAETGVTTMRLDVGLDTGDMLLERRLPIGPDATAAELFPELARIGAELLVETLAGLEAGTVARTPQDHAQATLAPILTRDDGRMDLASRTAQQAYDRWRGFTPWPGAWAEFRGKRFLVHRMRLSNETVPPGAPSVTASSSRVGEHDLLPNELRLHDGALLVGAADNTILRLDEVQLEGKPRLPGPQFARDFQLKGGESLA